MLVNENLSDKFCKINVDYVYERRDKRLSMRYTRDNGYTWTNWCGTNLFGLVLIQIATFSLETQKE